MIRKTDRVVKPTINKRNTKPMRPRPVMTKEEQLDEFEKFMIQLHTEPNNSLTRKRAANAAMQRNLPNFVNRPAAPIAKVLQQQDVIMKRRARSADATKARNAQRECTLRNRARREAFRNECDPCNVNCHFQLLCLAETAFVPLDKYELLNETQRLLLGCLPRGTDISLRNGALYPGEHSSTRSSATYIIEDDTINWELEKKRGTKMSFADTNSLEFYIDEYRKKQILWREEKKRREEYEAIARKLREAEERKKIKEQMKLKLLQEAEKLRFFQEEEDEEEFDFDTYDPFAIPIDTNKLGPTYTEIVPLKRRPLQSLRQKQWRSHDYTRYNY